MVVIGLRILELGRRDDGLTETKAQEIESRYFAEKYVLEVSVTSDIH